MKIKPMSPEEKLSYFAKRYAELKLIRIREKENPSPDHKGKVKVINIELDRLVHRMIVEFSKISRKKDLTDSK